MTVLGTIPINTDLAPSHIANFNEGVDTALGTYGPSGTSMLVGGSGVTVTRNAGANTFTIAATGGGGGGTITAVTDTPTVDLNISGTTLTADLRTTSTPQVAAVGVGRAPIASTCASFQCSTMTERVVDDTAHGENQANYGASPAGVRWNIYHGTSTGSAFVTTEQPTFKVSRTENITAPAEGAEFSKYSAIVGINVGAITTKAMAVGVSGVGRSTATSAFNSTTSNTDACGLVGLGVIHGSGTGAAVGGFFSADMHSTSGRVAHAIETLTRNFTGVNGVYSTSGASNIAGLWIVLGDQAGGSAIDLANPVGFKWDVGISFKSNNGGPCSVASIDDNSTAPTSLRIGGTHTTAAISVAAGSGKLLVGATSTAVATGTLLKPSADNQSALVLQCFSINQSTNPLMVYNASGNATFAILPGGRVQIADVDVFLGTATGTKFGTDVLQKIGFFNTTPKIQQTALTARDATAIGATYGATEQTVLNNVRTRLNELESRLNANTSTGLGLIAGTA